uniref:FXYD domain-containing ion transport regulator n=2 Tax=Molossus molossus TaxID=27622 RepID=A0A7J8C7C7_MOLMO|nr:FXYD domain containing ion transport regulator 5 [Molossus molossus]
MTEPVWVPARRPQGSPGHTLRLDAAAALPLSTGCRLGTPSSDMSPSGHLYLLTIVGLILPTRGQTLEETTLTSLADPTTVDIQALTPTPEAVLPELQSTPQTSNLQPGEATGTQTASQTQQTEGVVVFPTTDPGMDKRPTEASGHSPSADPIKATTLSKRSPDKDSWRDLPFEPTDSSEDNPFFYDEDTLRKHGLVVAAVLFITGIIILTSGKCRQLPRLCRNYNRTYAVAHKAQPEREDTGWSQSQADA